MIQEKSLNLPGPISSSNLGCNSEFSLISFLKHGTGVLARSLMSGFFWEVKLYTEAWGPSSGPFYTRGAQVGTASRPVTILFCIFITHFCHSHNHPRCDHSNFLFQILDKSLIFRVVLWEKLTVQGGSPFLVIFPPLVPFLFHKTGHCQGQGLHPLPGTSPGAKKEFSK